MEQKTLTCICCPLGCQIMVEEEQTEVVSVSGNTCQCGDKYARKEVTAPTRIVTTTVKVSDGMVPVVSVKTKSDIPKEKIFDCIKCLKQVTVKAPVSEGEVVLQNVAGTGVDIIVTKSVDVCAG